MSGSTARAARLPVDVPEVDWAAFWPAFCGAYRFNPRDADHVSLIGPTRSGKTTLAMAIARRRHYVGALLVKGRDDVAERELRAAGFRRAREIPPAGRVRRVAIWPPYRGPEDYGRQRDQLGSAMDRMFRAGVWTCLADEGQHMVERLHMGDRVVDWLRMGRTQGNGLILSAQRPAWMPRDIYSAPRHLFLFGTNDEADLRSIAGLNGVNNRTVRDIVERLGKTHRVLYVDTVRGNMAVTKLARRNEKT